MLSRNLAILLVLGAAAVSATNLRVSGACASPSKAGDKLSMQYAGKLQSTGKQFDANQDFGFTLGQGEVIKGWDKGLNGMCPGEERDLTIPPEDGYGEQGAGADIPGGATLLFHVKLNSINGGGAAGGAEEQEQQQPSEQQDQQ